MWGGRIYRIEGQDLPSRILTRRRKTYISISMTTQQQIDHKERVVDASEHATGFCFYHPAY
jgi:hypothetical protein